MLLIITVSIPSKKLKSNEATSERDTDDPNQQQQPHSSLSFECV